MFLRLNNTTINTDIIVTITNKKPQSISFNQSFRRIKATYIVEIIFSNKELLQIKFNTASESQKFFDHLNYVLEAKEDEGMGGYLVGAS
ncbi:MAG: hypothetical protein WCK98_06935 [bacterium]